ncbi:hypothetical protein RchiOBHm_Chr5g0035261 [Rosa chinensis]|uniref:Uncharacterized protein n=1 Tax=Rosa chinensis TaxID=74649 RepID=A0A2P6QB52_ROSCH|nr:hypothetical protein RchiOBHm_Chr5g0035261 [Rosa chinensis]
MGIWDTISGTTDSLKRNGADLTTALKSWCPTAESLKRIVPDGTTVKNACSTAYGYGSGVRDNVIPYIPNEEVRSKIY